jgi:hypothetical protein
VNINLVEQQHDRAITAYLVEARFHTYLGHILSEESIERLLSGFENGFVSRLGLPQGMLIEAVEVAGFNA